TVPPTRTEAAKDVWPGAFRTDEASARALGIKTVRPSAARVDGVRVVVESRNSALARRSVLAAGGRVERDSNGLVQAVVARSALAGLSERPGVDRVRAPYSRIETAVSGEEVGVALAGAWHDKGFTGKGVKVAIVDGGFRGLADRQAAGDLPANVVTQDLCEGGLNTLDDHGTA